MIAAICVGPDGAPQTVYYAHCVPVDEARGGDVLEQLLVRDLGSLDSHLARWLLSRRSEELALVLDPVRIESWDYSSRMSGAGAATGSGSLHH